MREPASCGHAVARYEVVENRWFHHQVFEICDGGKDPLQGHVRRSFVRGFFRQERAITCAKGLADGTWTRQGPIRAGYVPVELEAEL